MYRNRALNIGLNSGPFYSYSRYHTQPVEGSTEDASAADAQRLKLHSHGRHHTQPVTEQERQEAENASEKPQSRAPSGGISDR